MKNPGKIFIMTCCLLAGFLIAPVTETKAQVRKMSHKRPDKGIYSSSVRQMHKNRMQME